VPFRQGALVWVKRTSREIDCKAIGGLGGWKQLRRVGRVRMSVVRGHPAPSSRERKELSTRHKNEAFGGVTIGFEGAGKDMFGGQGAKRGIDLVDVR
jgi:hypothetical protein